jgi:type II secretory pathway component PulM
VGQKDVESLSAQGPEAIVDGAEDEVALKASLLARGRRVAARRIKPSGEGLERAGTIQQRLEQFASQVGA